MDEDQASILARLTDGVLAMQPRRLDATAVWGYPASCGLTSPFVPIQHWFCLYVRQEISLPPSVGTGTVKVGYTSRWVSVDDNDESKLKDVADVNKNGDYEGGMFVTVTEFFDAVGWNYTQMDDETVLELAYSGESGDWYCYAAVHEEVDLFVFYSVLPMEVAPADRELIAETITRINYSLPVGNFEIDLDAGDVRYKTSIDVENDRLSSALLEALINANLSTTDRYLPAFDLVLNEGLSPKSAVAQIDAEE